MSSPRYTWKSQRRIQLHFTPASSRTRRLCAAIVLPLACARSEEAPAQTSSKNHSPVATTAACSGVANEAYLAIVRRAVAAGVPGVQAYVKRGSERWCTALGHASIEEQQRMALGNRIRLASVTKMMTYATVMELVTNGTCGVRCV